MSQRLNDLRGFCSAKGVKYTADDDAKKLEQRIEMASFKVPEEKEAGPTSEDADTSGLDDLKAKYKEVLGKEPGGPRVNDPEWLQSKIDQASN